MLTAEFNLGILRILPSFLPGIALHLLSGTLAVSPTAARRWAVSAVSLLIVLMHIAAPEPIVLLSAWFMVLALAGITVQALTGPWPGRF